MSLNFEKGNLVSHKFAVAARLGGRPARRGTNGVSLYNGKHPTRLDRDFGRKRWRDEGYAMEELAAELGAAFLCAGLELTPELREDHASCLVHWLEVLKADKRAIFTAASHAQRAADFLHELQPQVAASKAISHNS
jgi:antirestriction protein ArdC